eukprot:Partr_v1_DN27389_c1_g1_i2_m46634 putative Conserved hypothetical protein
MDYDSIDWTDEDEDVHLSVFDITAASTRRLHSRLQSRVRSTIERRLHVLVTLKDKFSFVLGVTLMWSWSFVMGHSPHWLPAMYGWLLGGLGLNRVVSYHSLKWHYFLFDACYFVNGMLVVWLFLMPHQRQLYSAVWALANGPIAWAILAWRNSLVFHSLDKVTSLFIHMAPPLVLFTLRWLSPGSTHVVDFRSGLGPVQPLFHLDFFEAMAWGAAFYVVWQALYYVAIMRIKGGKVDKGERVTSYSWLLSDAKNKHNPGLVYRLCTRYGNGRYKRVLFMFWQLVYALITMVPAVLFHRFFWLHLVWLVGILTLSVWNGANYYFDVFSRRLAVASSGVSDDVAASKGKDVDSEKKE